MITRGVGCERGRLVCFVGIFYCQIPIILPNQPIVLMASGMRGGESRSCPGFLSFPAFLTRLHDVGLDITFQMDPFLMACRILKVFPDPIRFLKLPIQKRDNQMSISSPVETMGAFEVLNLHSAIRHVWCTAECFDLMNLATTLLQ